jgi:hypothetical protein
LRSFTTGAREGKSQRMAALFRLVRLLVMPEVLRTFLWRSAEEYPMGVLSRSPGRYSGGDNCWQAKVFRALMRVTIKAIR